MSKYSSTQSATSSTTPQITLPLDNQNMTAMNGPKLHLCVQVHVLRHALGHLRRAHYVMHGQTRVQQAIADLGIVKLDLLD